MGSKPNDIDSLKVLTIFFCLFFFLYVSGNLFFISYILFKYLIIFAFCSVIFSSTSGIKYLELNVNTPPICCGFVDCTEANTCRLYCLLYCRRCVCCRFSVEVDKNIPYDLFCLGSKSQ